jgi:hypothetical protein
MKSILPIFLVTSLFCFLLPLIAISQESGAVRNDSVASEMKTLMKLPKTNYLGVYLVPEYQYGNIAGEYTSMGGGSVMITLNKKLGIGAGGYRTWDNFTPSEISPNHALQLRAEFGGGKVEYTLNPNSLVHFSFPLMIGGGRASIDSTGRRPGPGMDGPYGHHGGPGEHGSQISFFLIQPGINVEANVLRFVKIFAGASYRIVSNSETHASPYISADPPSLSQLQGLSFSAGIKIGYDFQLHRKR